MKTESGKIAELKKLGFEEVGDETPKSLVISVYGLEKTGKTSLALGAPKPIAVFNFDQGLLRARKPKKMDGVMSTTVLVPPEATEDSPLYSKLWADFNQKVRTVLQGQLAKTVVIDTASAAWDLLRMSTLGKLSGVKPHHYTYPNGVWKGLIQVMRTSGVNVILLHRAGYAYETLKGSNGKAILDKSGNTTSEKTDRVERKGHNETGFDVDIEVGMYALDGKRRGVGMEIIMCGFNKEVEGVRLESEIGGKTDMCNFNTLAETCIEGWGE